MRYGEASSGCGICAGLCGEPVCWCERRRLFVVAAGDRPNDPIVFKDPC